MIGDVDDHGVMRSKAARNSQKKKQTGCQNHELLKSACNGRSKTNFSLKNQVEAAPM